MGDGSKFEWVSPALASFPWVNDFQQTLSSVDARLSFVTQHYYAGEYLSSQPVASDFLLEDRNATDGPTKLTDYIVASHSAGKKFRIGEMNSLSNGGQPGVSDSFSAALWELDIMFEFAKAGADGVNWHTGNGGAYGLFDFDLRKDSASGLNIYSLGEVRPLFYALQLFERGDRVRWATSASKCNDNSKCESLGLEGC